MEKTILIIEDNDDINHMIREALEKENYNCLQAFSGTEGLQMAVDRETALIILDLMLPGMPGEEVLPRIKEKKSVPVIVLSAKGELESKVELLRNGADDYLTKPFEIEELLARIEVLLRRQNEEMEEKVLQYHDLKMNLDNYTAWIGQNELSLTRQEFRILQRMLTYPKKTFSKQELYEFAWEDGFYGEDKTINVHISNIRKKIHAVCDREYIETIWGIGFRLQHF